MATLPQSADSGKRIPLPRLLQDLIVHQRFRFVNRPTHIWVYRGAGFYASPQGYDGGPWYCEDNPQVMPV